jgi:3-dehydroquinate dehydratase
MNGPNLDLLGVREPGLRARRSDIKQRCIARAKASLDVDFRQSTPSNADRLAA